MCAICRVAPMAVNTMSVGDLALMGCLFFLAHSVAMVRSASVMVAAPSVVPSMYPCMCL